MIDADQALLKVDPLRELPGIADEHKYPTHIRIGPDWLAIVSNLYTAWERTGDQKYRDKIQAGIDSILAFPNKIGSGENFGYDPQTGKLFMISTTATRGAPSLLGFFGGPELMTEILPTLNDPAWTTAWIDFCNRGILKGNDNARLFAFAAYSSKDDKGDGEKKPGRNSSDPSAPPIPEPTPSIRTKSPAPSYQIQSTKSVSSPPTAPPNGASTPSSFSKWPAIKFHPHPEVL